MAKSFYDLDYIIELNEKRLEQYNAEYNRVQDKYAVPIIVYSTLSIYLIPLIQRMIEKDLGRLFYTLFTGFGVCVLFSLYFFVKLLIPSTIFYQSQPRAYYLTHRVNYENQLGNLSTQWDVDVRIKSSYILELERAIRNNDLMLRRKKSFYQAALLLALLSVIPYIGCLGFHFIKKEDKIQRIELVNRNFFNFDSINFRYEKRQKK